ncbi:MAG: CRISPR-associated protein [Bacteroidales bacterium]|nr:CRISPR-associated protein [Bacteroidales bacterium]
MLINLSNHPSSKWDQKQLEAALKYGEIVDIPFPDVDASGDEEYIEGLKVQYLEEIRSIANASDCTIHLMGEMTFSFSLVTALKSQGYRCVASTSNRNVTINPDGSKTQIFEFKRFRCY